MNSVNASADIQSKWAQFIANLPSASSGEIDTDNMPDSMFATMLSQTQAPPPSPPPAPDPVTNNSPPPSNAQQASQPQQFQQSQNNNADGSTSQSSNTNAADNANSTDTSNATNVSVAGTTPRHAKTGKPDWSVSGKSGQHGVRKNADSKNSSSNSNPVTSNAQTQSVPPANAPGSANPVAATPANIGNPQPTDNQNDADADADVTVNAPAASTPASAANALTASASADAATNTPPAPGPNAAAGSTNAGQIADAVLPATVGPAPTPATPAATNADPTTTIADLLNAATAGTPDANAATTATTTAATNSTTPGAKTGTPASELLMMLAQIERLAANQAAATPATSADPAAGAVASTTTPGADPHNKIDLKSLLAEIAKLDGGTDTASTDPANDSVNLSSPSASMPAASQNSTPAPNGTSPADTTSKLISADFLNLFAPSATSTNAPANLPTFNPGVTSNAMITNDDGSALDADAQEQNSAGARGNSAGSPLDTNSVLPNAAPTQAASPYDFASQLSATRATQGGATGLPDPVEQVVLQLSRGLTKDGSSQMSIQLRPAELGRVDVKLNISSDGKVQGTVTADNPATLNLLLKDVRGLERALQEAGLRANSGSLQFGLRGDGQPGGGSNQAAGNPGFGDTGSASNSSTAVPAYADAAETYYLTPGGVNMRV